MQGFIGNIIFSTIPARLDNKSFRAQNRLPWNLVLILLVVFLLPSNIAKAQEKLKFIRVNPELQKNYKPQKQQQTLKSLKLVTPIELPFIDDFSSTNVFPDSNYWADKNVFINSTFGKNLKTIGVATFDIFDASGNIYPNTSATGAGADTLTSNPINLNYPANSNIWLSFYYQPGGYGDVPDWPDSLILEFYSSINNKWDTVWSTPGFSSSDFKFKCIPINDTKYLTNGFRFRFINIASLSNSDIEGRTSIPDVWNLDYVKIDKGRNENDSIMKDVAFSKPLKSLLKTYYSMPWSHYLLAFIQEIEPQIGITISNIDSSSHLPLRSFRIKELYTNNVTNFDIGRDKISAWESQTINADLSNPFKSKNSDSAVYDIMGILDIDTSVVNRWNDTVKFRQVFKNYFAYDDGSAESSYGISGQGTQNGMVAYGFYSYFPDTLRSVRILFNPTKDNVSAGFYFKLAVWANNNGKPGELIYIDPLDRNPVILGANRFQTYELDSGILVNETFFVGWIQSAEDFLNIGYDLNSPNGQSHLFYNIDGIWVPSGNGSNVPPGSLMIRPVMRTENLTTGIPGTPAPKEKIIHLYPNPAHNFISIEPILDNGDRIIRVSIFNTLGQLVKIIENPDEKVDITDIKPGFYIFKAESLRGKSETIKLLKEI